MLIILLALGLLMAAFYALRILFFLEFRQRMAVRLDMFNSVEIVHTLDSTNSIQRWIIYDRCSSNITPIILMFWRPFHSHYTGTVLEQLAKGE